ncbi:hypothetical protein [Terribacillus saccharophilus]|uniref:hypothetical protein n=1 Tax=Terribacillus saccharophilus TaxID=361277 RepID=UPI000BA649C3|nr:hypothetical protein [Terribacillus saccharophilus]PAF15926.1 hypothetical protein CHH51_18135 [Terribacillus saccharophilus]
MDMDTLVRTSKAVKDANDKGISSMWGDEIMLSPQIFNQVVSDYDIIPDVFTIAGNMVQLKFEREGLNFMMIISQEQYRSMKKRPA